MIKTIISEELPVKERFTVKKNIITGEADASVIFSASEKEEANVVKQSRLSTTMCDNKS
ncbi:MAG: hypothetical protein LBR18_03715 [Tannerella sp.]|jgi:hypothetical protein|nr:hypothetical protein [Tannerella sp.]